MDRHSEAKILEVQPSDYMSSAPDHLLRHLHVSINVNQSYICHNTSRPALSQNSYLACPFLAYCPFSLTPTPSCYQRPSVPCYGALLSEIKTPASSLHPITPGCSTLLFPFSLISLRSAVSPAVFPSVLNLTQALTPGEKPSHLQLSSPIKSHPDHVCSLEFSPALRLKSQAIYQPFWPFTCWWSPQTSDFSCLSRQYTVRPTSPRFSAFDLWCRCFSSHSFKSIICLLFNLCWTHPLFPFPFIVILVRVLMISYQFFASPLTIPTTWSLFFCSLMSPPPNTTADKIFLKHHFQCAICLLKNFQQLHYLKE